MRKRYQKPKKRISALDKYLIYCIVFFTLYCVVEQITSCKYGVSHDVLTNAVKWFCGGEVFLCAMIKRLKLKKADETPKDTDEGGGYYDD